MKLMGKKRGMTQIFDKSGNVVFCTVIHAEPNVVTQIKKKETDGYDALQLAFEKILTKDERTLNKRLTNQLLGHFRKANIAPRRYLAESRVDDVEAYSVGQELGVSLFAEVSHVDVSGVSKGKGFQGTIKKHGFAGGPGAHGSGFHRHGGSTGMRTTPGRCYLGRKKAGQMGNEHVTMQNLRVIEIHEGKGLIFVEGSIPGPRNGLVMLTPAKKKRRKKG